MVSLLTGMVAVFLVLCVIVREASSTLDWSYDDQDAWSDDYPYCSVTTYPDQSPIDIITNDVMEMDNSSCTALDWMLDATANETLTFHVENSGAELVVYITDEAGEKQSSMQLAAYDGNDFCLDSFHFHWAQNSSDAGSEHLIDGEQYPLEVHFVHYLCEFANLSAALDGFGVDNTSHELAVVAIFFTISETDNETFFDKMFVDEILQEIEEPAETGDDGTVYGYGTFNASFSDLFADLFDDNETTGTAQVVDDVDYYRYDGSLTTPPCYDTVRWHIVKDVFGSISEYQMNQFRTLLGSNDTEDVLAPNFRATQTNPNDVYLCSNDDDDSSESVDITDGQNQTYLLDRKLGMLMMMVVVMCVLLF